MLCCVIAGALLALVSAKLAALPIIGPYLRARQDAKPDASAWRLEPTSHDFGDKR